MKNKSAITCQTIEELTKAMLEAQYIAVQTGLIQAEKPGWFDELKFKAGQDFVDKYFGSLFYAHLIGLLATLFSPRALKPLIYTNKSETPRKAYQRYISTTVHIMSWYRGDVWNNENIAYKSLQQVRNYHENVASVANSPDTRCLIDTADISSCGRTLHNGRPLLKFIRLDLSRFPGCPVEGIQC
jgi:ER-bound oxygenase mpaB/B'/Rubber oxygenase, catalytic domain